MSEPYVAEIKIFAGNFAPRGYAFCDGRLLQIAQNTAVFSLIGTIYGGDGRSTTALPDLRGRAPMHPGQGPGLTARTLGEKVGVTSVTLTEAQMPSHHHGLTASEEPGDDNDPAGKLLGRAGIYAPANNTVNMNAASLANQGGSQPHTNQQPFLAMYFIFALVGLYPSRS